MHPETILATIGCTPEDHQGVVNTPVYRGSTILFPDYASFAAAERGEYDGITYGRYGTKTSEMLEHAIATLEGADHAIALSSGLAAITTSLLAFLKEGDHLLMTDSVYGPARRFCDFELKRFGVETTYYDPEIGAGIAALIKPNTRVVYTESPGSLTFEMQDIPAIAKAAHDKNCIVISDNTWASPLYMRPFELGIDISIHSGTKHVSGHSDLVMGFITCKQAHYAPLLRTHRHLGACPAPDNCYLAHRGLRTMAVRLKQHQENALIVSRWLQARTDVEIVLNPALPGAPGHELWQRDFTGACGLFTFVLKNPASPAQLSAMLDTMEIFGMGYSWGGYESLLIPIAPKNIRTATQWPYSGQAFRSHVGLEHPDDILRDLEQGLERLAKAK
jgi:cystathionine beta-lyase